jgi:Sulfotransferase family
MASVGRADEISRKSVIGWAADNENVAAEVELAIVVNGKEMGRIRAKDFRDDLTSIAPGATGRYGFEFKFEPALSLFDDHNIEVKVADTDRVLPGGARKLSRPTMMAQPLLPILVTSSGRAGSTLLMQYLSQLPEVVVGYAYPYELKLANYYSAAFSVLAADEDRMNSTDPETMFDGKFRHLIGSNPYTRSGHHGKRPLPYTRQFFDVRVPAIFAETFRSILLEYYTSLKSEQNKPSARFFAEKSSLDEVARKGPRIFFGTVREVVLVRDPRDQLCSSKAFWKLSSQQAMRLVIMASNRLEDIFQKADSDMIVVKYEDLVTDTAKTMQRVLGFIGVERSNGLGLEHDEKVFAVHATSKTPAASIGRWRTDLSEEEIEQCERHTEGYMKVFDYKARTAV